MQTVTLKSSAVRRIRSGHPWVFSNELQTQVKDLPLGGSVDLLDPNGSFVGRGYANPRSLIAVRLLTRNRREDVDHPSFYVNLLREAKQVREARYPERRSLRLVHGEADGLPGLVVDRFGDTLAVQITTLGMETRLEQLQAALTEVFAPTGAVFRNDVKARELEGLAPGREVWFGEVPEFTDIDEWGVRFRVALQGGQKTGHFFDQADNRHFAATLLRGKTVLDLYANTGGWALHALAAGATRAVAVDKSKDTAEMIRVNAEINGFSEKMEVIAADAGRVMEAAIADGQRYGAVVLDPPAFAKTRKVAGAALKGYQKMNALALSLVEPGGFLFTSSCSYHIEEERFLEAIAEAARLTGRRVRVIRRGEQAGDHPVLPAVPETRYLKSYALHVALDR